SILRCSLPAHQRAAGRCANHRDHHFTRGSPIFDGQSFGTAGHSEKLTERLVSQRFLLPEDAARLIADADASSVLPCWRGNHCGRRNPWDIPAVSSPCVLSCWPSPGSA